jgi:MFS family permease
VLFGTASILLLALFQETNLLPVLSVFLGFSLGFGLSTCFAILAENTLIEERTRTSALIILELFLMVPLIMFVAEAFNLGLTQRVLLVMATRFTCFLPLIYLKHPVVKINKKLTPLTALVGKNFILYLFPWVFFNIAAGLSFWGTYGQQKNYSLDISLAAFYICAALFGLLSGFIADRIGRRLPSIIGIALGGISFAILGYSPNALSYLVSVTILGVAWGFLLVVYLAIPGDIAGYFMKEKFYAFGTIMPLILYLGINAVPRAQFEVDISKLFPIISIFLFLAVVPILAAEETLPIKKIQERKMNEHIKKVGKLLQETKK